MSTRLGDSVVAKRGYIMCPMILHNRVTYIDLVELDMYDLDVILGMDWLHAFFSSIRTRVVKFNFPNEPLLD